MKQNSLICCVRKILICIVSDFWKKHTHKRILIGRQFELVQVLLGVLKGKSPSDKINRKKSLKKKNKLVHVFVVSRLRGICYSLYLIR